MRIVAALALLALLSTAGHAAPTSLPPFDGKAAFALLQKQVDFGPRVPGSAAHEAALKWMLEQLQAQADRVMPHSFTLEDPYGGVPLPLTNIKASFRPQLQRRVAFAAHWDSRPRADQEPGGAVDRPIPAANDGASGVAVLLLLAEILHAHPPSVGVDLLFFDGEDWGKAGELDHYLLGSRRFVEDFPDYRPQALILLDMVGDADLHIPMEAYSMRYAPDLTRKVFEEAARQGLACFEAGAGPPVYDDHIPFLQQGIAAVDLVDLDYPYWHTLEDTPEHCSPSSLGQVGRLLVALIFRDFAN